VPVRASVPSPMRAEDIRCQNDRELFDSLLEEPDVKRANDRLERMAERGPSGVRWRLLATSVRLTRSMAGTVHAMADECSEKLEMDTPLELFVYSSPQYNAACFKPEEGRVFVMFSSSLLEAFEGSELRFVMGHELGHHVYRHHDIPIGYLLGGGSRPSSGLALELFAWSRYAEISADRAGAHCARDPQGVARALFKLASGLTGKTIEFSLDDFLAQLDDMQIEAAEPGQDSPREDWFSTHPFSPLRVKALQLFDESELAGTGETPAAKLEVAVQALMGLMEPSYLEGHTDAAEAMRRLLFAGSIAIAQASGEISESEVAVFEQFFGEGAFRESLDVEALEGELANRIEQARAKTSIPQRMQVLRDLCIVARAEGKTSDQEREVLAGIADGLAVPKSFVAQTMACGLEPD